MEQVQLLPKKKKYERETEEGTVLFGAIYTEKPGFKYQESLKKKDPKKEIQKLKEIKEALSRKLRISGAMLDMDRTKYRICTTLKIVERYTAEMKEMNYIPAIVEETINAERIEIQINFL